MGKVIFCVIAFTAVLLYCRPAQARYVSQEELRDTLLAHGFPEWQIPTWQCIVQWESSYETTAHNPTTGDHGLFQLSELYWCSPPGTGCGMSCDSLKDDDINNDVECARIVYDEFERMTGNGFEAWVAYQNMCR